MSGPFIGQVGQVARRDMVPPVEKPIRFRAFFIVGGILALSQAVFTATSTPKWLGAPNSREDSKMRESTHHQPSDEITSALELRRQDPCFGETFMRLSEISAKSSPFDPQGATMRCVLPGGPGKTNQGGFGLVARKGAQSFCDEDSLFIAFEEFREFYPTFGRTEAKDTR